jgi:hypothetical protein
MRRQSAIRGGHPVARGALQRGRGRPEGVLNKLTGDYIGAVYTADYGALSTLHPRATRGGPELHPCLRGGQPVAALTPELSLVWIASHRKGLN